LPPIDDDELGAGLPVNLSERRTRPGDRGSGIAFLGRRGCRDRGLEDARLIGCRQGGQTRDEVQNFPRSDVESKGRFNTGRQVGHRRASKRRRLGGDRRLSGRGVSSVSNEKENKR
jgi:hypothetical protein